MRIHQLAAALALGAAAVGLSGCATGLKTEVSRYSALPAPAGQTFYVVPASGTSGGLEFGRYASIISQQLEARGYRPAGAPQLADMLVKVGYDVDEGQTEYRADSMMMGSRFYDPFYSRFYDPFYGGYYGRPYYSRFGYSGRFRDPFYFGWGDPFYDPLTGGYGDIREYTTYKSELDLDIVRRADNASLFEGKAQAKSATDNLGVLVPNLIEAMFTNFPGRNGETVKITIPNAPRG